MIFREVLIKSERVGVREAKMHLSRYLKVVRQGGEVILTERGVPIGKIVPLSPEERSLESRLDTLEQKGILGRPPSPSVEAMPQPIAVPDGKAQSFLQEDRENA